MPGAAYLLRSRVKHRDAETHQHVSTHENPPESDLHASSGNDRADEDDTRAAERDDVRAPPVEDEAADDGEDGVDEGVGTADDAELGVGDAQFGAQRVLERAEGRSRPGVADGQGDDADEGDPFVRPGDAGVGRL